MRQVLERMGSMLNVDPQLLKNVTNITIRDVVKDFSDVFGRLVTRNNVKVSYLRFVFFKFYSSSVIYVLY